MYGVRDVTGRLSVDPARGRSGVRIPVQTTKALISVSVHTLDKSYFKSMLYLQLTLETVY